MELDDQLCLCFHVSKRKVINFIRIEKPRKVAQLSDCYGAGTGCGWCRPFLKKIFDEMNVADIEGTDAICQNESQNSSESISVEDYAARRAKYVNDGGGTPPPGATLI